MSFDCHNILKYSQFPKVEELLPCWRFEFLYFCLVQCFTTKVLKNLLSIKNYNFEIELNSVKVRVGIYVSKSVEYTRMTQLEGVDSHIVIIDISNCAIKRVINVYRGFNPQNNVNARTKFKYQLEVIKNAMTDRCIVVGDFNLDYSKAFDVNYGYNIPPTLLSNFV